MEKNTGKVSEFCQSGKVGTMNYLILVKSLQSHLQAMKFQIQRTRRRQVTSVVN